MKRTLIISLVTVLIPVFMGLICPCAMAAPADQPTIQKVKCHGCCPEISAPSECHGIAPEIQPLSNLLESTLQLLNYAKALSPAISSGVAISNQVHAPPGDKLLASFSPQPLYLSLRVLRI